MVPDEEVMVFWFIGYWYFEITLNIINIFDEPCAYIPLINKFSFYIHKIVTILMKKAAYHPETSSEIQYTKDNKI